MTIIAAKGNSMSCDSCWASSGIVNVLAKKITRLTSGGLLGQAGDNDAREVIKLFQNVKTDKALPSRNELMALRVDFHGLLLLPNGKLIQIATSNVLPEHIEDDVGLWEVMGFPYAAVGSGADIALGAFFQGATTAQAVAAACRHQVDCRPPIHTATIAVQNKKVKK